MRVELRIHQLSQLAARYRSSICRKSPFDQAAVIVRYRYAIDRSLRSKPRGPHDARIEILRIDLDLPWRLGAPTSGSCCALIIQYYSPMQSA